WTEAWSWRRRAACWPAANAMLAVRLECQLPASSRETSRFQRGRLAKMSEVTRILSAIEQGDPSTAEQLLPLVYDELRRLAAQRLAHEKPGQTLEATALVHEVYLRLAKLGAEAKKAVQELERIITKLPGGDLEARAIIALGKIGPDARTALPVL